MATAELDAPVRGSVLKLRRGGLCWQVAAEFEQQFFDADGLRLEEWLKQGAATVVKKGPHRVVYRVALPELCFYVKHNLVPDMRTWLRQLVRPAKARLEHQRALAVAARGIPTIEPIAVGAACSIFSRGESYLITRNLPETVQLNDFLEQVLPNLAHERRSAVRKRLACALGQFIAHLHDAGVVHNDLHCGNILIRLDEADEPQLFLIDLQAVQFRGPLNWRQSRANLVIFNRWLSLRASRSDRHRFWRAYVAGRVNMPELRREQGQVNDSCWPELARQVETATAISNERFWRDRDQRCLQATRHHRRLRSAGVRGYAAMDLDSALVDRLSADPDAPFRRPGVCHLKKSRSVEIVEFAARLGGEDRRVIYKRFAITDPFDPLWAAFRPTPALRSWIFGHSLRERGLPTARPLLLLHRVRAGLVHEGYLLMEKVHTSGDLRQVLDRLQPTSAVTRCELRARVEQLARLICALHERNLAHRDLKAANVLLDADRDGTSRDAVSLGTQAPAESGSPFCFIDLVGVSRCRRLSTRLRIKNLARLHASFHDDPRVTRTDKLRFLRTYLRWGLYGREGWKTWWRGIDEGTRTKVAKNLRNGRPLA